MNRAHLVLALSLCAACATDGELSAEQKQNRIELYTETAQQHYQIGDVDRAEAQAVKGLELDPENEKLKLIWAWSMQRRGRTDDILRAEKLFRDLVPNGDYRAVLGLAEALERKGSAYEEASENVRSGKRVTDAPDPEARADELQAMAREAWTESLVHYEATIEKRRDDPDALNGAMRVEALRGNLAQSLDWSKKLIEVTQADLDFFEKRAVRPEASAQQEDEFRRRARQRTDVIVATHVHASTLAFQLGRREEALEHLDRALELAPDRAELHSRRAQVLKDVGRYQDAIDDVDKFIKLSTVEFSHPDIQRAWRLRSECEQGLRRGPGAR